MNQSPAFTPAQLSAVEVLNRIKMAWVALYVVLGSFLIGLFSFLGAVFMLPSDAAPKTILGGIDVLLGFVLRQIIAHLFPAPSTTK